MKTNMKYLLVSFITILTFTSFKSKDKIKNEAKPFVIMIDPGHGGRDSGTPGTGRYKTTEKDIALDVSLALGKLIESKLPNVKVVFSRKKDVFPTLQSRPTAANKKEADLFISIHCNAQPGKKGTAYGSETYVLGLHKEATSLEVAKRENSVILLEENHEKRYQKFDPNSPESLIGLILMQEDYLEQSINLASFIENEFKITAKRKSRGVKQAGFWVLAHTSMPSVLVELGFLTHKKEEDFLNSKRGKVLMVESLFKAVRKYVNIYNDTNDLEVVALDSELSEASNSSSEFSDIIFKVQIAAGARKLETKPYNFNGLRGITSESIGNGYKYFYGETSNYDEIKKNKEEALEKGYASCFIIAYKNGTRINISDALKTNSN